MTQKITHAQKILGLAEHITHPEHVHKIMTSKRELLNLCPNLDNDFAFVIATSSHLGAAYYAAEVVIAQGRNLKGNAFEILLQAFQNDIGLVNSAIKGNVNHGQSKKLTEIKYSLMVR